MQVWESYQLLCLKFTSSTWCWVLTWPTNGELCGLVNSCFLVFCCVIWFCLLTCPSLPRYALCTCFMFSNDYQKFERKGQGFVFFLNCSSVQNFLFYYFLTDYLTFLISIKCLPVLLSSPTECYWKWKRPFHSKPI